MIQTIKQYHTHLLYLSSLFHALCIELIYHMMFWCLQSFLTFKCRLIALITFPRTLCSSPNSICPVRISPSLHAGHMVSVRHAVTLFCLLLEDYNTFGLVFCPPSAYWSTLTCGILFATWCKQDDESFQSKCWGRSLYLTWPKSEKDEGNFSHPIRAYPMTTAQSNVFKVWNILFPFTI